MFVAYFMRSRIVIGLHWALHVTFPALAIVCLSTMFLPQIYTSAADNSLKAWGTFATLQSIDSGVQNLISAPQNIFWGIQNLFGTTPTPTEKFNYAESQVYPTLVNNLSLIFRLLAGGISILGMLVIIYLSYATGGVYEAAKLKQRVKELETRVDELADSAAQKTK